MLDIFYNNTFEMRLDPVGTWMCRKSFCVLLERTLEHNEKVN